ncbi:xanthine dehydrogenase family protein molybdopterin-binding subunit, partial [Pseudonocardia zijingensis]|uniref:xanthine dehydrogenase family protein molybdopterin-binding subunit n=1 Tax=Pseudonocardia zijingensis TaxID=153376 RepID=UPI0031D481C0
HRRAAAHAVVVDFEVLPAITDAEAAAEPGTAALHPGGNLVRHMRMRHGDPVPDDTDLVRVSGEYHVGMQDQAFLGPESCLAEPTATGGVHVRCSTQWLHIDRDQLAEALGLPPEQLRLTLAGVGGAFGGREDLSVQAHAALLALRTGRPVAMSYPRRESFVGHVHRHPARMRYTHTATRDGRLVAVEADILLDGGAYASTSPAVVGNAGCFAAGPYAVPTVHVDARVVYTNNPPCGAMRGFGAIQVCFAYESQMDELARVLGMDPVELRLRNAVSTGSTMATGQTVDGPAPVAELLERVAARPPAPPRTDGAPTVRGVGYGVSIKNICKSAGVDDYGTARVRLFRRPDGRPAAQVQTAASEVGQGLVTVQQQIVRTELGVDDVGFLPTDTTVGDAGTASASRQTWMSGGAVQLACRQVRAELLARAGCAGADLPVQDGAVQTPVGPVDLADLLDAEIDETAVFRHRTTSPLDENGQGDAHVAYAFAAHRVTVDVDVELGTIEVVEVACAQDVGKAVNPLGVAGQMHGGIVQGLGLAVMEEIQVRDGRILNPGFTDYLIPTAADVGVHHLDVLEHPRPDSPYGLTGVGEPPMLSVPAAVAAAVRQATGADIRRVPIRPQDLTAASG